MEEATATGPMGEFESYILTLRSELTRQNYAVWIREAVHEPNLFLELARTDRPRAERIMVDYTLEARARVGGATIRNHRAAVKGFLDYYEVQFPWKKIKALAPPARTVASDRAPELDELRKMWAIADPRERLAMSFLASMGGRRGVFQFPRVKGGWGYMRLADVVKLDDGTAAVAVYPGEPEEYRTLVSPEAVQQFDLVLELRARAGERLVPDSPVMRDEWQSEYSGVERPRSWHPEEAKVLDVEAVAAIFKRLKHKAGILTTSRDGGFKAAHGFRKYFKSNFPACPQHGDLEAEVLMGHRKSYDKLSWEHLRERYRVAVPHLVIDEKFRLQEQLQSKEEEHRRDWTENRLETLELKERVRELEKVVMENMADAEEIARERRRQLALSGTSHPPTRTA